MQVRLASHSYILYQFQMDESWSIRAGTTSALENHAATYPVICLGHVRVMYVLNNRNDVGKHDLRIG